MYSASAENCYYSWRLHIGFTFEIRPWPGFYRVSVRQDTRQV
jgi:hypothetical protein